MTGENYITSIAPEEKYIVEDAASGSKAFVPIQADSDTTVHVVTIDKGLITGLPEKKKICDKLIFTTKTELVGMNITWLIELKGTKNEKEVRHAIKQIEDTIGYLNDEFQFPKAKQYVEKRDYVFASVVGAPDKTIPYLTNDELKALCKKLFGMSQQRKNVKNMYTLFCYIQPNPRYKKATLAGNNPPYNICCYKNGEGYIPYPKMLMEIIK